MRPISPRTLYPWRFSSSSLSSPPFSLQISHFSTSSSSHNFHTHSSFRRHDEDVRNVRVSVWWDFENCHLPAGFNVFKVANAITAAIRANGIKGPIQITAFGDMLQLSRSNQEALSSTGVNLTHVPNGGKNSADRSLLVDLMYWVSQNPPPAHLFLISGDRDFATILHRLRMINYNILLASTDNAPAVLCGAASIMWSWHALLTGENLTGKCFNQPPDGPYGSWYGHYKVPLEDPYSVIEQPELSQTEKLSEPGADSRPHMMLSCSDLKPRPIPHAVMNQIHKILKSHPKGISITDLRLELAKCNLSIDRDFYGYKKFTRFLLSFPHILRLQPLGEGNFLVHAEGAKSSVQCEYNPGMSAKPVSDNRDRDLDLSSQLDCGDRSGNVSADRKLALPTCHERNVEQPFSPNGSFSKDSDEKSLLPPSPENAESSTKPQQVSPLDGKSVSPAENVKTSVPNDEKVVEMAKAKDPELHFPPAVAQDSAAEVGCIKRIWRKWFGRRDKSVTASHNGPEDFCTSGDGIEKEGHESSMKQHTYVENSGKTKDKETYMASTSQVVDQAPPDSSSSTLNESAKDNITAKNYELHADKPKTGPGVFDRIVSWCKFGRSSPSSDKSSEPSYDRINLKNTHSEEHKFLSTDSFWGDMRSFMDTPKGSVIVSQSRTREQMALNLQKEGPLFLRSLSGGDLLHLVDLFISEKKWVEECPSQTSPFRLTHCGGTISLDHSNGSNRLRSIWLGKPSHGDIQRSAEHNEEEKCRNIPHSGVSLPTLKRKPSDRSRNEIIADCQKLLNEVLKEYPEGYNMGLFRKLFLDRYGYHLDLHMLGYQKLASLLLTMSGVKIVSSQIVPTGKAPKMFDAETSGPSIQKPTVSHTVANSDTESSYVSNKDDGGDSPWEELGPVAHTSNKKEVELASKKKAIGSTGFDYEAFLSDSDSEEETSPVTESDEQGGAQVNKEDSSLLQILDSWYSSKDGETSKDKSEEKSENVDGMVGTSLGNNTWKQRPQKSYSFVANSVGDKNKLIDGILGSLKKSSEPRMEN